MNLTHEQKKEYLDSQGVRCPLCRSRHVMSGPIEADGPIAWADVTCSECGAEWTDEYALVGIAESATS